MKKQILLAAILCGLIAVAGTIDLNNLNNYANQTIPNYINKDNTPANNQLSDDRATLGRVLFYDKNLSVDNSIACASCHMQEFAFGDTSLASIGVNGLTGRHSMRLVNARFSIEEHAFWDERVNSLEEQATQPIQDHAEMGFSGQSGDPDLDSLIRKMEDLIYYQQLFTFVYGDPAITETRLQLAIAQFVRSIQSFDSKYDIGLAQANNPNAPFPNFTNDENAGKALFTAPPQFDNNGMRVGGGVGCQGCHAAPEFDIDPNTDNNGVINALDGSIDVNNTRAPSLRDVVDQNGNPNGPFMHNGQFTTLLEVINHYNSIPLNPMNTNLDNRLRPGGNPQNLQLTTLEKTQLIAFIQTLTGSDIYTNPIWSDPFEGGFILLPTIQTSLNIIDGNVSELSIFPNPANHSITVNLIGIKSDKAAIYNSLGQLVLKANLNSIIDISNLPTGYYIVVVGDQKSAFIKQN